MLSQYMIKFAEVGSPEMPDGILPGPVKRTREEILGYIESLTLTQENQIEGALIKPWARVSGTAESVKVEDVLQSIRTAPPDDLHYVIAANRRLPEGEQFFTDYQKIENDIYMLSIKLRNPKAYVEFVGNRVSEEPPKNKKRASITYIHVRHNNL